MFVQGIIVSSATLVAYVLWFLWFLPFDFDQTYDFTVLADAGIVLCCLVLDTTDGLKLLNLSLAAAALSSLALRFITTDCTGCEECETYVGPCLHNGCGCSPRSGAKVLINAIPVATALFRVLPDVLNPKVSKSIPTPT